MDQDIAKNGAQKSEELNFYISIEKHLRNRNVITNVRFMKKKNPVNVIILGEPVYPLGDFLLAFANSKTPVTFINKAIPFNFRNSQEDIQLLHEAVVGDFDILSGNSGFGQLGENLDVCDKKKENELSDKDRKRKALLYMVNSCSFIARNKETFFNISYELPGNLEDDQDTTFMERRIFKISVTENPLEDTFTLLFVDLVTMLLTDEIRSIKKCPICERFFIPSKNKLQGYCSSDCKAKAAKQPFYKAYRNVYTDIKRDLPEGLEEDYEKWKKHAKDLLITAQSSFLTSRDFQKYIRSQWNGIKNSKEKGG